MITVDCRDVESIKHELLVYVSDQVAAIPALKINEFSQMQSATEVPVAGPIPEGFFDLELNVNEIKTSKNIWQKVLNWFDSF